MFKSCCARGEKEATVGWGCCSCLAEQHSSNVMRLLLRKMTGWKEMKVGIDLVSGILQCGKVKAAGCDCSKAYP